MLEVGWSEILVIALILIIVVGPKDLPGMLRNFGQMAGRVRKMANEFKGQFNEALREAELDDVRNGLNEVNKLNPASSLRDAMNPIRQLGQDIKSDLNKASDFATKPADATKINAMTADPVVPPTPVVIPPAAAMPTPSVAEAPAPVVVEAPKPAASEPVVAAKSRAPRKKAEKPEVVVTETPVAKAPRASRAKATVEAVPAQADPIQIAETTAKPKTRSRKPTLKAGDA